jgi:hypothetical protein
MKSTIHPAIARLALLAGCFGAMAHAATIFNFDNDAFGTVTPFTDTVNGLSATFSSPGNPGVFEVQQSFFETLTGNVLITADTVPLTINFSSNLSAITLVFATSDFTTPSPLTLTAYEGNTAVGSDVQVGQFLPGFIFPEGEIAFDGTTFNSVVLSTPSPGFAIDNVEVATATPEPRFEWMVGVVLIAVAIPGKRRRSH